MSAHVSSAFINETRSKTPTVVRKFTIAGSDYSSRMSKWPKFNRGWDDIRPKSLQVKLGNGDQGMNFLREDKTLMVAECLVQMGIEFREVDISNSTYDSESFSFSTQTTSPVQLHISPDGLNLYIIGAASLDTVFQYVMTEPFDLSTISYASKSFDISTQETSPAGLYFKPDGTKMYVVGFSSENIFQYTLSTPWDVSTASYDSRFLDITPVNTSPRSIPISPDGTKLYVVGSTGNDSVFQYTLSTPWDISTGTYDSVSFDLSSQDFNVRAIFISPNGEELYMIGASNNTVYQYEMTTPFDLSTISYASKSFDASTQETNSQGVFLNPANSKLFVSGIGTDSVYQYSINKSQELITLFSGKISNTKYANEDCTLKIKDKFQQLSERQVGNSDVPVDYQGSNYLVSDIAWWTVTSYGGYSNITSTSNPDIDYQKFSDWAEVFSADAVFMNAQFDGQKCTEVLRKIARNTQSAIFINDDKLTFHRFGIIDATVTSLGPSEIKSVEVSFDTDQITNKQYVSGDYSVDSDSYGFTVDDESTSSVNSFGLKENVIQDKNLWYINSGSAINLAERKILTDSEPDDSLSVVTGLQGLPRIVGETLTVLDAFHGISESYRILEHEINTDNGETRFRIDRTQLTNPFILDTTSLGSLTEVLS